MSIRDKTVVAEQTQDLQNLIVLVQETCQGLKVEALESTPIAKGVFVVDLNNIVVQAPLAVSILKGNGVVDELEQVRDGGIVGQGHIEEDVTLGQTVAPHVESQSKISIHTRCRKRWSVDVLMRYTFNYGSDGRKRRVSQSSTWHGLSTKTNRQSIRVPGNNTNTRWWPRRW